MSTPWPDPQTAVMDALPHATHPTHDNWRAKADALITGLRQRGYDVVPIAEHDIDIDPAEIIVMRSESDGRIMGFRWTRP
jgi:hypothetical protein